MQHQHKKSYQILLCVELNNLGVSLIENGQHDLAIESLKQVVHTLKASMTESPSIDDICHTCSKTSGISNDTFVSIIQQDPVIKLARSRLQVFQTDDSCTRQQHSSAPPYFNLNSPQKIQVGSFLDEICANNDLTMSKMFDIISATVLFNIGVAHHKKAFFCQQNYTISTSSSSSIRSIALEFYNISWSMLLQIGNESLHENSWYEELCILVLNNLCFLYREQGQYVIARECLAQLGTIIIQKKYPINLDGQIETNGTSLAPAA